MYVLFSRYLELIIARKCCSQNYRIIKYKSDIIQKFKLLAIQQNKRKNV